MRYFFVILSLFINSYAEHTINANVNDIVKYTSEIEFAKDDSLSINIFVSNFSLVHPLKVVVGDDTINFDQIEDDIFITENLYQNNETQIVDCDIFMEILAGNDTICDAEISYQSNNDVISRDTVHFIIDNDAPMPYYRFPTVKNLYPNPAHPGDIITLEIYLDYDTDIELIIYDNLFKAAYIIEYNGLNKGLNEININSEHFVSSGIYYLSIDTGEFLIIERICYIK